jgi:hypothetical protein
VQLFFTEGFKGKRSQPVKMTPETPEDREGNQGPWVELDRMRRSAIVVLLHACFNISGEAGTEV